MDELREACAEVAGRGRQVRVVEDAIATCASSLEPCVSAVQAAVDGPHGTRAERAAYWLTLDAINFGSGWFPTLHKPEGSGYATISAAWRRRYETEGPFSAEGLAALEPPTVAAILGQNPAHELMELFTLSLRDLGARLQDLFGGDPLALVDAAHGSAVALAMELGGWPCFADRSRYDELSLPFLKRAQLAAADLRRAGVAEWRDTERLTMFADNLVPHVLRLDGVLSFDPRLVDRIEAGQLLAHGSPEEVEMRACAVHAVELIVAAGDGALSAAAVDEALWRRGQQPGYKARPRPRCRCTAY